jgi:hypothetical protein
VKLVDDLTGGKPRADHRKETQTLKQAQLHVFSGKRFGPSIFREGIQQSSVDRQIGELCPAGC